MEEETLASRKSKDVYEQVKEAEKEKKTLPQKLQKKGSDVLRDIIYYATPLISLGIFVAIFVFGTFPSIQNGILARTDEIKEKNEVIEDLDEQIATLEDLKASEYQFDTDIEIIDKIVPSKKTQVVRFITEIAELAQQSNLEESQYSSGEHIEVIEEEVEEQEGETGETAAIINIPTTSEYTARFENIKDFLNALYMKDDFIIVKELEMKGSKAREYFASLQEEEGREISIDTSLPAYVWTMEVTFEKYQFNKGFASFIQENLVPLTSEPDNDTLEFIRGRYGT